MLINLLPDFLDILAQSNPEAAYHRFLESHRPLLAAYWNNYVLDPDSPHAAEVIAAALRADRSDLYALLEQVNVAGVVEETLQRAEEMLGVDRPTDCVLMVGMGAANAGELVVGGRGVAFICVEHFTGRVNPETYGMGLAPELIPLWVAHEVAHAVRYTAADSASEMRRLIAEAGGYYDYWTTGSRATLRELLINEGLAVHASQAVVPGLDSADYFGYPRRQYQRMRELEAFLRRAVHHDLDRSGLGLRLKYLSGGMSPSARLSLGRVLPERSGYYLGHRMAEPLVAARGIARALRAPAAEFQSLEDERLGFRTA
ncbi:MAG: hypothetical protein HOP28_10080 [Gemmatimonadales bacterium]|nr:hypothetical protein [Gemmatimonadales bacterium]